MKKTIIVILVDMKELQTNFTTPEQSKRLLELGVPEDSADMVYVGDRYGKSYDEMPDVIRRTYTEYCKQDNDYQAQCDYPNFHSFIPCWSVGRLIEILSKCMPSGLYTPKFHIDDNIVDVVLDAIELELNYGLDFSKLED